MDFVVILIIGLLAGTLGGIVGFGSSIMLMPVLVIAFGPLQAVPIMAIAAIMANLSRIIVWWMKCVANVCPRVCSNRVWNWLRARISKPGCCRQTSRNG